MDDDEAWQPDPEPWESWLSEEEKIERVREVFRQQREQHPRPANAFDAPPGRHERHYARIERVSREAVARKLADLIESAEYWLDLTPVGRRYSPGDIYAAYLKGSAVALMEKLEQVIRAHGRAGFMVESCYPDMLRMLRGEGANRWPEGFEDDHLRELEFRVKFFARPEYASGGMAATDGTTFVPALVLGDRGGKPVVRGVEKQPLTSPQFDTIKALQDAGERGLSGDELARRSKHTNAVRIVRNLRDKDEDWAAVIQMPGRAWVGYRIAR